LSLKLSETANTGTIRGQHAADAPVSFVPWPTYAKVSTHSPGMQYHFRIAAVSNAGISPFLYHALKLYSVFPRIIPGIGGTEMYSQNFKRTLDQRRTDWKDTLFSKVAQLPASVVSNSSYLITIRSETINPTPEPGRSF